MEIVIYPHDDKYMWELLLEKGINVSAPCGGMGKCKKCRIKILEGVTSPCPDEEGFVLACRTKPIDKCRVYVPQYEPMAQNGVISSKYAVCDIGTTNIKILGFDSYGTLGNSIFFPNPQCSFGADVISRISHCKDGGYLKLSDILISSISEKLENVEKLYICGNPTMIHFAASTDPSSIGSFPFSCVFKDIKYLSPSNSAFPCDTLLLPSASGYVGSDAVCGIYSMWDEEKTVLIADLGTNGEISLIKKGKAYSATTAAGPAIEGAGIEMGLCGGEGTIYDVDENGNAIFVGKASRGISGSGLISGVAYLLKAGLLSSEGHLSGVKYYLTEDVYISNKDITSFMVAKSAVKTAISMILRKTETEFDDVDDFILTGGISNRLNISHGADVGLFPKELKAKARYIPNLAAFGASDAVMKNEIHILEEISKNISVFSLSDDDEFESEFVMNTFFDL